MELIPICFKTTHYNPNLLFSNKKFNLTQNSYPIFMRPGGLSCKIIIPNKLRLLKTILRKKLSIYDN